MEFSPSELLLIVSGLLLVFGGWLLYRAVINVTGGVLGAGLGIGTGWSLSQVLQLSDPYPLILQVVFGILTALTGAYVFRLLDRWAFFLFGLLLGAAVMLVVYVEYNETLFSQGIEATYIYGGLITGAVILGLFVYFCRHTIVIIACCALGTMLLFQGLQGYYGGIPALIFFPIGVVVQRQLIGPKKKTKED